MANKIYYITRSFAPFQNGGGPLMRKAAVENLRELGWDVTVVMPNYQSSEYIDTPKMIQIPFLLNKRVAIILEMVGIYEDYLDKWVNKACLFLKNRIQKDDIIFSSAGGELGTIKLGSLLKKEVGCKFVVNFRDPIVYTKVHDLRINDRFHVSRESSEKKYISNADLIITSSKSFQKNLINKYPQLKEKIFNNYFGYIHPIAINQEYRNHQESVNIAYVGNMESTQKPELLYDIYKRLQSHNKIKIYFIGDYRNYNPLQEIKAKVQDDQIEFIELLPHEKFLDFMQKNIDIGFVSLSNAYLGACVPSKIYEYINLAIPMLGALPDGDGKDIINDNQYGIACDYNDMNGLVLATQKLLHKSFLQQCRTNIINSRDAWSMKTKILEVDYLLKEL